MLEPIGVRLRWHFAQDRDHLKDLAGHEALFDAVANHNGELAGELAARHIHE